MKKSAIYKTVQIALMTVFIAVCAWITIPSYVPFTLQTFGVYLSLLLLGGKKGFVSILLYILLGAAGLPVFSGAGSGFGYILGPTGGYLFGFVLCSLLFVIAEAAAKEKIKNFAVLGAGTLLCYAAGTLWFMLSTNTDFIKSFLVCALPFAIPDTIKLVLALHLAKRLKKITALNL